jgi:phosphotransferase system  glucose/maltose/N-acetylglucosamine-specific IIC component
MPVFDAFKASVKERKDHLVAICVMSFVAVVGLATMGAADNITDMDTACTYMQTQFEANMWKVVAVTFALLAVLIGIGMVKRWIAKAGKTS